MIINTMIDVSDILARLRLETKDFKDFTPDIIENIFTSSEISVKDVAILCRSSRIFNQACSRQFLWKKKVMAIYGYNEELPGKTWRETAKIYSQFNMINLNKKWINGTTYRDLLEDSLDRGYESLLYLEKVKNDYINEKFEFKSNNDDIYTPIFYAKSDSMLEDFAQDLGVEPEDISDYAELFADILTRELGVIAAVVAVRYYSYPYLPGIVSLDEIRDKYLTRTTFTGDERKSTDEIFMALDDMYDYFPYVMEYSRLDDELLHSHILPDTGGKF